MTVMDFNQRLRRSVQNKEPIIDELFIFLCIK